MCMKNRLQSCFPIIRTREEVLSEIYSRYDLTAVFSSWTREQQKETLQLSGYQKCLYHCSV